MLDGELRGEIQSVLMTVCFAITTGFESSIAFACSVETKHLVAVTYAASSRIGELQVLGGARRIGVFHGAQRK